MFIRFVLISALAQVAFAGPAEYRRQILDLPMSAGGWLEPANYYLTDFDGDGLTDVLAVEPGTNQLWIFRQQASGFSPRPSQVLNLPPDTAWMALCDLDPHPDRELVLSGANGLSYLRQNHGTFESEPRMLVSARQVFTNSGFPLLFPLDGLTNGANFPLPIISATQVVLNKRNSTGQWTPGPPEPLEPTHTLWRSERCGGWMAGAALPNGLRISQSFQTAMTATNAEAEAEKREATRKLEAFSKVTAGQHWEGTDRVDANGDGREDLILWRVVGEVDFKTEILVFLRGADQRLPVEPSQVLHCRGFPIFSGHRPKTKGQTKRSSSDWAPSGWLQYSPVCQLREDGKCQIVLAAFRVNVLSSSGLVDMFLSGKMNWTISIRGYKPGGFARNPDAAIPLTTVLPTDEGMLFLLDGDFNGDGLPDLLVRSSATTWDVLPSKAKRWFASTPLFSYEVPAEGRFNIRDLNGDGLSDVLVQAWNQPKLFVFLSHK